MKKHVIIVAGGTGKRMNAGIPKQFICLVGQPILIRTIRVFREYDKYIPIILVLPGDQINSWKKLCTEHDFTEPLLIVQGGDTRFQSVKKGLDQIQDDECLVAIHDGVRPLITKNIIERVFVGAGKNGSTVPCVKINDSIRIKTNGSSVPFDRNNVFAIQTPQCFKIRILKKAYNQSYHEKFTDDATVVESAGAVIHLVEGSPVNFKITTPLDLLIAETFLKSRQDINF